MMIPEMIIKLYSVAGKEMPIFELKYIQRFTAING